MIKSLPTEYRGVEFRSRLEARWAVYFDEIGIEWFYELEGFALPSGPYLPDFWLPQVRMWAEVKPADFSEVEKLKCSELAKLTGFECLMLDGPPSIKAYKAINEEFVYGYMLSMEHNYPITEHRFWWVFSDYDVSNTGYFEDIKPAVEIARAYKFDEYHRQTERKPKDMSPPPGMQIPF